MSVDLALYCERLNQQINIVNDVKDYYWKKWRQTFIFKYPTCWIFFKHSLQEYKNFPSQSNLSILGIETPGKGETEGETYQTGH